MSKNLASSTDSSSSSEVKQKTKPTTKGGKPTTTQPQGNKPPIKSQPKKPSSSSSSSSSKAKKPQTTTKTNPTQTKPQANAPKQNGNSTKQVGKKVDDSTSSSSSSDVKMGEKGKPNPTQPTKNVNSQGKTTAQNTQAGKNATPQAKNVAKKDESSDSSSSSSDVKLQKGNATNTPAKKGPDGNVNTPKAEVRIQTRLSSSGQIKRDVSPNPNEVDTSDSSDSDDVQKKAPTTTTQKTTTKPTTTTTGKTEQAKKKKDDDSDSSDSSSEMLIDLNKKTQNDIKMANNNTANKRKRENDEENNAKKRKPNINKPANNNGESGSGNTKVRVGNLSFDLDGFDDDIKAQFQSCGEIKGIEMIKRNDGRWAGVAILEFADEDGAKAALNMNDTEFYGRKMSVTIASENQSQRGGGAGGKRTYTPSQKPEGCTTVFIGNLNFNITEDQVYEFFADCGDIKECRWPKGDFTGIGWVEFYDTKATDLAVKKAGQNVMGRDIRVDYAAPRKNNF